MSLNLSISKNLMLPNPEKIQDVNVKEFLKQLLSTQDDTHKDVYTDIDKLLQLLAGLSAMSNALDMGTHKITGIDTPTSGGDAVNKTYADGLSLWAVDGTETQLKTADEIDMQSKKIINVTDPTSAQEAATKAYADTKAAKGANSDITSLAGLTTALSTGQGGTGLTANANAANGIVTLNGSSQLPAVSGALLTNLPISSLSNVIFEWYGIDGGIAQSHGWFYGTSLLVNFQSGYANVMYNYLGVYNTIQTLPLSGKFKKIAGISTVTIQARLWSGNAASNKEAVLTVNVGGQTNTVKSVESTTPTWVISANIDVSSLTNGTVYDITFQMANEGGDISYCSAIVLIGS